MIKLVKRRLVKSYFSYSIAVYFYFLDSMVLLASRTWSFLCLISFLLIHWQICSYLWNLALWTSSQCYRTQVSCPCTKGKTPSLRHLYWWYCSYSKYPMSNSLLLRRFLSKFLVLVASCSFLAFSWNSIGRSWMLARVSWNSWVRLAFWPPYQSKTCWRVRYGVPTPLQEVIWGILALSYFWTAWPSMSILISISPY